MRIAPVLFQMQPAEVTERKVSNSRIQCPSEHITSLFVVEITEPNLIKL